MVTRVEAVQAMIQAPAVSGEEVDPPDDLNLTLRVTDDFMFVGVSPANFKVAELFCRNRFGESAVDMGFERGLVVDCATG